jgi:catechol 2,3-dioxygenase-like lactoylglutathione lyase family enzyme
MLDEFGRLLVLHERGLLDRRQLLGALLTVAAAARPMAAQEVNDADPRKARTINHVTLSVADLPRSQAFYEQLLGARARSSHERASVLSLDTGFLVLDTYAGDKTSDHPRGIDHFCVGIEGYEPARTAAALRHEFPSADVRLEYGKQVYIRDPDGAMVQFSAADYIPQ